MNFEKDKYEGWIARRKLRKELTIVESAVIVDRPPLIPTPEDVEDILEPTPSLPVIIANEDIRGRGVQSTGYIKQGAFIGLIEGEVICRARMEHRGDLAHSFDLYYPLPYGLSVDYFVDVGTFSSPLGLCNHSCTPNATMFIMVQGKELVLAVYAKCSIRKGGFIHLDYYRFLSKENKDEIKEIFPNGCKCKSLQCRFS
jgi:SET domain-containing protein